MHSESSPPGQIDGAAVPTAAARSAPVVLRRMRSGSPSRASSSHGEPQHQSSTISIAASMPARDDVMQRATTVGGRYGRKGKGAPRVGHLRPEQARRPGCTSARRVAIRWLVATTGVVGLAAQVGARLARCRPGFHRGAVIAVCLAEPLSVAPAWAAIVATDVKRVRSCFVWTESAQQQQRAHCRTPGRNAW
eukprot:1349329-Prymnesium_polylepis.1